MQLGWETRLVPFGKDVSAADLRPRFRQPRRAFLRRRQARRLSRATCKYNKNRIFAFVLALGEVDADKYAAPPGPSTTAFPSSPTRTSRRFCRPASAPTSTSCPTCPLRDDGREGASRCAAARSRSPRCRSPSPTVRPSRASASARPMCTSSSAATRRTAFEFVTMRRHGPDQRRRDRGHRPRHRLPSSRATALPLAIWVEVAGRKMQADFEPILERQIHHLVNGAEGIWHMGQRDIVWTRVSKAGYAKGLRLRHYGEILHAKLLDGIPGHRGQGEGDAGHRRGGGANARVAVARKVYNERNRRLESMTDESVDTFYSCLLCQSFAPEPRLRHHARAPRPVRRLQLARRQGRLRDRRDRPQPAGAEGRMPGPGRGHVEGRQRFRLSPTATRPSSASPPTRIMDRPHDELRLLRGHLRLRARVQRRDGRSTANSWAIRRSA